MTCHRGTETRRTGRSLIASLCLCVSVAFWFPALLQATTITGSVRDAGGNPVASGTLILRLSQEGTVSDPALLLIQPPVTCTITNGQIDAPCTVRGNDTISPAGTFYRVRIVGANGQELLPQRRYVINGASFDFGAATPLASDIIASQAYQVVQDEGASLIQQRTLNFVGGGVTAADDPADNRTTVAISGGGGGGGSQHQVDGTNVAANDPINFQDSATIGFSNPSAGNIQAGVKSASVTDAMLGSNYSGVGTCTNQAVTATNDNGAPTCSTITSAFTSGTFAPDAHALAGSTHTAGSLTTGNVVRATGATTFAWQELGFSDLGGAAAKSQLPAAVAYEDEANVFTTAGGLTLDNQLELRLREADANGDNFFGMKSSASRTADYTVEWAVTGDCTGNTNGGALTLNASNQIVCSDDDGGAGGGGDNISANGTAATDADFDDATPAAPSDGVNVRWQKDAGTPNNISANLQFATGSVAGAVSTAAQTFGGQKTFSGGMVVRDNNTEFQDDLDNTKRLMLQLANIATATTRTWTAPDASGEVSLLGQTIEDAELASNYSGVGACTNQFVRAANDNAAPTCATVAKTDAVSTFVHSDQANTYSTGAQDFAAASSLKVPTSAGASPTASGVIAYDSTSNTLEYGENGANRTLVNSARTLTAGGGLTGGGDLSANRTFDVAVTSPIEITSDSVACSTCTTDSNAQTLTNKTLDVEGTGNSVTTVSKHTLVAAGCNNATAGPGWDIPTSNGPASACYGTAPQRFGGLDFPDGASALTSTTHLRLPSDWTGTIDVAFLWFSGSTSTNSVVWTLATACIADGEGLLSPTFNTTQTVSDANNSTANTRNSATISSITTTGCAAGETLFLRIGRDPTNGSDTLAAAAVLLEFEVTLRRAQ